MQWIVVVGIGLLASQMGAGQIQVPKTDKERLSYALGMDLGKQFRTQSVEVDPDLFRQGLRDALFGDKTLLTEAEIRAAIAGLQEALKQKQIAAQNDTMLAAKQLAEKNQKEGEAFLVQNKAQQGVVTLASGLQYKILKAGDGNKPRLDDAVVCHYRGTVIDGTEFDSSYKRSQPATFPVKGLIKGWTEALQLMPVGSKWQLVIPASLAYEPVVKVPFKALTQAEPPAPQVESTTWASVGQAVSPATFTTGCYGERGVGGTIGPNSTLIFELELLSIQAKP